MNDEAPRFYLSRVFEDGRSEPPEIVRVGAIPMTTQMGRRGFLGAAGITGATVGAAALAQTPATPPADAPAVAATCGAGVIAGMQSVERLQFLNDGSLCAIEAGRVFKIWEMPNGALRTTHRPGSGYGIDTLVLRPDGTQFAESSHDGVRIKNVADGAEVTVISPARAGPMAFSPDGSMLAVSSGNRDGKATVYPLASGRTPVDLYLKDVRAAVQALRFSPDGAVLAIAGDGSNSGVERWDLARGARLTPLESPGERLAGLVFTPDGNRLAATAGSNTVCIWRLADETIESTITRARGFRRLSFSHDGRFLATVTSVGSVEGRRQNDIVRIWSVPAGTQHHVFSPHEGEIKDIAFSPSSPFFVTAGSDKTIKLWSVPEFEAITCLFDRAALERNQRVNQYRRVFADGQTIISTQPCGMPIPAGAVCTCNCVSGTYRRPVYRGGGGGGYGGGSYCTCNQVCVCVPVCQAHRLLDGDSFVRAMAAALVRRIAAFDSDYIRWAAQTAPMPLRECIAHTAGGRQSAHADHAFPLDRCFAYFDHPDEVTRIMAAQHLALGGATAPLAPNHLARVHALLRRAKSLHWRNRARLGR